MAEKIVIYTALFLIYYHIGGLATTNIIRLTRGNALPILSSKCVCDSCGTKIPPLLQLPIISYLICKGKCKNCGTKIPLFSLALEAVVMFGMFIISFFFKLSAIGVVFSFVYYEIVRVITIMICGKRETSFGKSYTIAVLSMLPFMVLTLFVSIVYSIL